MTSVPNATPRATSPWLCRARPAPGTFVMARAKPTGGVARSLRKARSGYTRERTIHGAARAEKKLHLQHFRTRTGFELDGIRHHAQHAVVTDCAGELDHALVAEARMQ